MDYYTLMFLTITIQFKLCSPRSFSPIPSQEHILRVSAPRIPVSEDDQFIKIVLDRMDGSVGALTVHYFTVGFTAREEADFQPMNGTILFKDGQTEATVEVRLIDDDVLEPVERFFLLFDTEKAHIFSILSIYDDDIYSAWTDWSDVAKCCTAACRLTECVQTRTRTCEATYRSMCSEQLKEVRYRSCFSDDCDMDDGCWSGWGQWTSGIGCKSICKEVRIRECLCDECSGPRKETKRNGCQNLQEYTEKVTVYLESLCPKKGGNPVRIARIQRELDTLVRRMTMCENLTNEC